MELIWIATGVLCVAAGTRFALMNGSRKIPVFAFMALICFCLCMDKTQAKEKELTLLNERNFYNTFGCNPVCVLFRHGNCICRFQQTPD